MVWCACVCPISLAWFSKYKHNTSLSSDYLLPEGIQLYNICPPPVMTSHSSLPDTLPPVSPAHDPDCSICSASLGYVGCPPACLVVGVLEEEGHSDLCRPQRGVYLQSQISP